MQRTGKRWTANRGQGNRSEDMPLRKTSVTWTEGLTAHWRMEAELYCSGFKSRTFN